MAISQWMIAKMDAGKEVYDEKKWGILFLVAIGMAVYFLYPRFLLL